MKPEHPDHPSIVVPFMVDVPYKYSEERAPGLLEPWDAVTCLCLLMRLLFLEDRDPGLTAASAAEALFGFNSTVARTILEKRISHA